mmetsp:Transcript_29608/g.74474  ORF Transcript_29608/g.74474 Transcript_29608/m.74474 type:complete len:246 (+) Transcript_29608:471-1208(+)
MHVLGRQGNSIARARHAQHRILEQDARVIDTRRAPSACSGEPAVPEALRKQRDGSAGRGERRCAREHSLTARGAEAGRLELGRKADGSSRGGGGAPVIPDRVDRAAVDAHVQPLGAAHVPAAVLLRDRAPRAGERGLARVAAVVGLAVEAPLGKAGALALRPSALRRSRPRRASIGPRRGNAQRDVGRGFGCDADPKRVRAARGVLGGDSEGVLARGEGGREGGALLAVFARVREVRTADVHEFG